MLEEKVRLNSFGERIYFLFLDDYQLVFGNTSIKLADISHFKFGAKILQFGMFPVGRSYYVSLKTANQELNLVLRSFFGIRDNYLGTLYEKLVNGILLRIGARLFQEAITAMKAGKPFAIGPCTINGSGIMLRKSSDNPQLISWNDLSYQKKYDRLVINSKSNHAIWLNLYFLEHWNVEVLMDVLDWLFEEGGLAELKKYSSTKE